MSLGAELLRNTGVISFCKQFANISWLSRVFQVVQFLTENFLTVRMIHGAKQCVDSSAPFRQKAVTYLNMSRCS